MPNSFLALAPDGPENPHAARRRMLVVAGRKLTIDAPGLDIRGEGANRRAYWICPAPARDHFSPIIQRLNYNLDDEEEVQQMAERCRFLWYHAAIDMAAKADGVSRSEKIRSLIRKSL